jgi:hypothetical protein
VLVLPRLPTALFSLLEEPGVPAGPKLLPVVPWLCALPVFAPTAPPVPFTMAPVLIVAPDPDDVPPVETPGEELPDELPEEPPAAPPLEPPPLCANAGEFNTAKPARSTTVVNFMADPFRLEIPNFEQSASFQRAL